VGSAKKVWITLRLELPGKPKRSANGIKNAPKRDMSFARFLLIKDKESDSIGENAFLLKE
jgi:hypothetical protein